MQPNCPPKCSDWPESSFSLSYLCRTRFNWFACSTKPGSQTGEVLPGPSWKWNIFLVPFFPSITKGHTGLYSGILGRHLVCHLPTSSWSSQKWALMMEQRCCGAPYSKERLERFQMQRNLPFLFSSFTFCGVWSPISTSAKAAIPAERWGWTGLQGHHNFILSAFNICIHYIKKAAICGLLEGTELSKISCLDLHCRLLSQPFILNHQNGEITDALDFV